MVKKSEHHKLPVRAKLEHVFSVVKKFSIIEKRYTKVLKNRLKKLI